MGTSSPYPGPNPKPPLLPSWATGDGPLPAPNPPEPIPPGNKPPDSENTPLSSEQPSRNETTNTSPLSSAIPSFTVNWTSAKTSMSRAASGGSKGYKRAGTRYVAAQGGSKQAASRATSGRQASARLGGFLAGVSSAGLRSTLESLGAIELIGQPLESALSGIIELIAPTGATLEDALARAAVTETLVEIFESVDKGAGKIESLESVKAADIRSAIEMSVANYIYTKWLQQLTLAIEKRSMSAARTIKIERDVKAYVRSAVRADLKNKDPLRIDWHKQEGRAIIDAIYEVAYAHLEEEE